MPIKEAVLAELRREIPEQFKDRMGFVMQCYGCSIFEEYMDGYGFKYTAVNNESGKSELVERRQRPLPPDDDKLVKFALKVRDSRIGGLGLYEVAPSVSYSNLLEIVQYIFRTVLPNAKTDYKIREEQIALAEELLESLIGRWALLAEAPTGLAPSGHSLDFLFFIAEACP